VLFDVQVADREGWIVLAVVGELDLATAPKVRQAVIRLLADTDARGADLRVAIDLSGVDLVDSIGLGVMIGALRRVRAVGGSLALVVSEPRLLALFAATDLDRVFTIHPDLDTVLGGVRDPGADPAPGGRIDG